MTQAIIDQLIKHYSECIATINMMTATDEDILKVREILKSMETGRGICWCAMNEFGIDLYHDKWIASKKSDPNDFFFDIPFKAPTRARAIELLQMRIDIMKTFIP